MSVRKRLSIALLSALSLSLCLLAGPAQAYRGWYRPYHPGWYAWHHGLWRHGWYGGRFGWWWVVGGAWYLYPQPVYPYPDAYVPPDYPVVAAPTGPAPPLTWYYCPTSKTYYPYVTSCTVDWQAVPATSAPPAATPPG